MGFSRNDLKIMAMHASGATRAALEAIAGDTKGTGRIRVAPKEDRTAHGIVFASKREMQHYLGLKISESAGLISDLTLQPRYLLQPKTTLADGTKLRAITYVADFKFRDIAGFWHVIDVKGIETDVFRIKKKMFRARYPELTFEIWK